MKTSWHLDISSEIQSIQNILLECITQRPENNILLNIKVLVIKKLNVCNTENILLMVERILLISLLPI